jgi:hypothetical protein
MKLWQIQEISNGCLVSLPDGRVEFYDGWDGVMKRLGGMGRE